MLRIYYRKLNSISSSFINSSIVWSCSLFSPSKAGCDSFDGGALTGCAAAWDCGVDTGWSAGVSTGGCANGCWTIGSLTGGAIVGLCWVDDCNDESVLT